MERFYNIVSYPLIVELIQNLNNYSGLINVVVISILAIITYWYARSTTNIVEEMKKTRESSKEIMEKSITAQAELQVLPKIQWEFIQEDDNKKLFKIINKGAPVSNCKLMFYIEDFKDFEVNEDPRKITVLDVENNTNVTELFSMIQESHPTFTGYIDFSFISLMGGVYRFKYRFSGSWDGPEVRITEGPKLVKSSTPWNI